MDTYTHHFAALLGAIALSTSLASLPLWHQLLWGAAMAVVLGAGIASGVVVVGGGEK